MLEQELRLSLHIIELFSDMESSATAADIEEDPPEIKMRFIFIHACLVSYGAVAKQLHIGQQPDIIICTLPVRCLR